MQKATTLFASMEDKYLHEDDDEELSSLGHIVLLSNTPGAKKDMFPPIITLCDYGINSVGSERFCASKLANICELDLTDNKISTWKDILIVFQAFPNLNFLNLSNNSILPPSAGEIEEYQGSFRLRKLILNGNPHVNDWSGVRRFTDMCPELEELHLSKNEFVMRENEALVHPSLVYLYMSRNPDISDLEPLLNGLKSVSTLKTLSVADCSITKIPGGEKVKDCVIHCINLSGNPIRNWNDIDHLRDFKNLSELRIQNCPFSRNYPAIERRMLLIARLPNIRVLNGGDFIPDTERENAERSFIRYYLDNDESERPSRWKELVAVHGNLDPLVNVNFATETSLKLKVVFGEVEREEVINLYQTVAQFKQVCSEFFNLPPEDLRVFYIDQDTCEHHGPQEMRLIQKELYTYNIQIGDSFMIQEKYQKSISTNGNRRRRRNSSTSKSLSRSPKGKENQNESTGMTPPRRKQISCNLIRKNSSSPKVETLS